MLINENHVASLQGKKGIVEAMLSNLTSIPAWDFFLSRIQSGTMHFYLALYSSQLSPAPEYKKWPQAGDMHREVCSTLYIDEIYTKCTL